jgi:adenine-specific DNA-methyltransferase
MGHRYIGSKTRVLTEILASIREIIGKQGKVADLMCGTSSVSAALRRQGYSVIANDVMTYSWHHARVSLLFSRAPMFKGATEFIQEFLPKRAEELFPTTDYEKILKALQNVPSVKGYFWREFSVEGKPKAGVPPRNYFLPANAKKIDGMRKWLRKLNAVGQLTDLEHSLLLHDLIMAANDVANIAGTYGHFMSHISGRAADPIRLVPTQLLVQDDDGKHRVLKGYAEDVAKQIACDLCYIDPPYMKRQYAANYHILETLAREDNPPANGVSGLRPWRDQYSDFCTKTRIRDAFRKIFSTMECRHFLVSYSEDGLLSVKELQALFSEFGRVKTQTFVNKRFKSNNSELASQLTEYIIHLEKN